MRTHWKRTGGIWATWALGVLALAACGEDRDTVDTDTQADTHTPSDADTDTSDSQGDGDSSEPPCPLGHALVAEACQPCASGTWSDGSARSQCWPKTDCAPGTFVSLEGGTVADRLCDTCPSDTTTTELNQSSCEPGCAPGFALDEASVCQACRPGQYCAGGQSPALICEDGTWDHDLSAATACVPLDVCEPGTYRLSEGNAGENTRCEVCEEGSYSDQRNAQACQAWTSCERHQLEVSPGSALSDRVCEDFEWLTPLERVSENIYYTVKVGPEGDVYVGGTFRSLDSSERGALVQRFTPEGDLVWEWRSPTPMGQQVYDLAISQDQVFLVGETWGTFDENTPLIHADGFLAALSVADGQFQWSEQVGSQGSDMVSSIAIGAQGTLYVAGESDGMNPSNVASLAGTNGFIRAYSPQGELQWSRVVGTAAYDRLLTLRVASEDLGEMLYVMGSTYGQFPGYPAADSQDMVLAKYTDGGALEWLKQIPMPYDNSVFSLTEVVQGRVCTLASIYLGQGVNEVHVACYGSDGSLLQTLQAHTLAPEHLFLPTTSLLSPQGDLWLVGVTYSQIESTTPKAQLSTWSLSPTLELLEMRILSEDVARLTTDASLSLHEPAIYAVGYQGASSTEPTDSFLYKLKR